jgi:putative flippase GtrA
VFFFTLVNLVAVAQTWIVSVWLADYLFPQMGFTWHIRDIAHAVGVGVPVLTSYVGHKKWSFKQ